jgi:hypothetical protein
VLIEMALFLLALLAVGASATEDAPVISLNLAAGDHPFCNAPHSASHAQCPLNGNAPYNAHPNGNSYTNTRTFADEVNIGDGRTGATTPLPVAVAYDHHEGQVVDANMKTTITLFSEMKRCEGSSCISAGESTNLESNPTLVSNWATEQVVRGQYVVEYEAVDHSGNEADRVLFALIALDVTKPDATLVTATVEYGQLINTIALSKSDNYDSFVEGPTSVQFTTCAGTATDGSIMQSAVSVEKTFCDFAGIFGQDNVRNCKVMTFTLAIEDNTPPQITEVDFTGVTASGAHECRDSTVANQKITGAPVSAAETNVEADCFGHSSKKAGYFSYPAPTYSGALCDELKTDAAYTFLLGDICTATYYAKDKVDNEATAVTREWTVIDTQDPIVVVPSAHLSEDVVNHKDFDFNTKSMPGLFVHKIHDGAADGFNAGDLNIQVNSDINLDVLDDKLLGMSCQDVCGGGGSLQQDWSPSNGYSWVESCAADAVSGGTFDATVQGEYFLKFQCTDDSGRTADLCRKITNVGVKPILSINCVDHTEAYFNAEALTPADWGHTNDFCDELRIEAHGDKEYVDAGADCSDIYGDGNDGNHDVIHERVVVSGDVVDMAVADTYHISYQCNSKYDPLVWSEVAVRTVIVVDEYKPFCDFSNGDGQVFNVEASFPYNDILPDCHDKKSSDACPSSDACEDNQIAVTVEKTAGDVNVEATGAYTLTYRATDANNNFDTFKRTVTVTDTLAPQIHLDYSDFGFPSSFSPALPAGEMAQSSSANGWLIGALASAVTGVALISFTASREDATTVPV